MGMIESFSNTYLEAREKFIAAAREAGATIHSYQQPGVTGKDGEVLSCDVAIIGPREAQIAGIVISGTHGVEGYCGSAIQHRWLSANSRNLVRDDVCVILVHAANPWAFSHKTRTTENNVDLNRNFISHQRGHDRRNQSYDLLVPFYHATDYGAAECLDAFRSCKAFLDQNGWHIENEMLVGQSHRPDGLFYVGTAPEWANDCFRSIVRDHLTGSDTIGFIDWHTGVGSYGEIVYLCFDDRDSDEYKTAAAWWALTGSDQDAFAAGTVPNYQGLLCQAVRQELPSAKISGAVIEFGTCDAYSLFRADRLDRWLRFEGRNDINHDRYRIEYRNACCPDELAWSQLVLTEGPAIMDRMFAGLSRKAM